MKPTEPLPLNHSWPIFERTQRFDLGWVGEEVAVAPDAIGDPRCDRQIIAGRQAGKWACDLTDSRLTWSDGVYDIFGLPRGSVVARSESVALYAEHSRAAMERLRAYAIKHRRGFTLDAEIAPFNAARRWMRLICVPICDGKTVVRLEGLKQDVTDAYL